MENIFFDIGIVIIVATLIGYMAKIIKQPFIPFYILTGFLIGPIGLGLITDINVIKTLAEIGIAFLLFVVGLELEFKRLKDIGLIASVGGTVRALIIFLLGFLIASIFLLFNTMESIYIGFILAFSSTMVVVKLLSDKKELDTLHGRIIIGILLMEDILAILILSSLSSFTDFSPWFFLLSFFRSVILIATTIFASKFIFPTLFKFAAKSQELLFLLSVTMCFLFSMFAVMLEFSIAIGAFVAGVALANLPYNIEIIGKVKPLRDFFSVLFFVTLGMELTGMSMGKILVPLLILVAFVIVFKPLITIVLCSVFGYAIRTSFLTGISLAQTSEFGLIIILQGLVLNHISQDFFSLAVMLAVITIIFTSYLIKFDNQLYFSLSKYLKIFDKVGDNKRELKYIPINFKYDAILVGYDRIGYSIARTLRKVKKSLLVIDFNPDIIKKLIKERIPCLYGDIGDMDIIERLDIKHAQIIISTVPEKHDNLLLIKKVKETNNKAKIFVTAYNIDEALELYDNGADYVILPHFLGGDHVSLMLEDITKDISKLIRAKVSHIEELRIRKGLGHEHPRTSHKDEHQ